MPTRSSEGDICAPAAPPCLGALPSSTRSFDSHAEE